MPVRALAAAALLLAALAVSAALPASAAAQERCLYQELRTTLADRAKVEGSLLCLTNLHRLRSGEGPLRWDTRLARAARAHSADMVKRGYFDHFTPEGASPADRAEAAGYAGGGISENIARNPIGTAAGLFKQWRNSSGHDENMLRAQSRTAGFGVHPSVTGTQMFAFGDADTRYVGFDLYASDGRCAKAKLRTIAAKRALRRAKRRLRAAPRRRKARLRRVVRRKRAQLGRGRAAVRGLCRPPA